MRELQASKLAQGFRQSVAGWVELLRLTEENGCIQLPDLPNQCSKDRAWTWRMPASRAILK